VNAYSVLALNQYEWSALLIVLVLVAIGSCLSLRWCKRTAKDIVEDLQGSIDLDHELNSVPQGEDIDIADMKQQIKDLLKQAKADLAQTKQERADALEDAAGAEGSTKKMTEAKGDYGLLYDLKAKDCKRRMDRVQTLLKTIPESDAEYHTKVSAVIQKMENLLQSLHPHQFNSEGGRCDG